MFPLHPSKASSSLDMYVNTLVNCTFLGWVIPFYRRSVLFIRHTGVKCVWVEYQQCAMKPVTNLTAEWFSAAYCNMYFQTELIQKYWRYPWKSMCTATGALTGVSVVVLGHSVGVVWQKCVTQPSNILKTSCSPLKYMEFFTAFMS
jgi:hypothetical protein